MAYDMNAEGINGVVSTSVISNIGWQLPIPPDGGNIVLQVNGLGGGYTPDLVAVQCVGSGVAPGLIGQTMGQGGGGAFGVGVAGFSLYYSDINSTFNLATAQSATSDPPTAGVFGQCDGGPGVQGQGGKAVNPTGEFGSLSDPTSPLNAGFGVLGGGGASAAALKTPAGGAGVPAQSWPALPAGAGVVGIAGDASMPGADIMSGTGVVGIGSPPKNGITAGRGGVFSSEGNVAQARLIPAPTGLNPRLPESGNFGDLYVTLTSLRLRNETQTTPSIWLCVTPDDPNSKPPTIARWAPFILGEPQEGGNPPIPPIPYEPV